MSIYKKINDFKTKVGAIKKDSTNPHFKNKYASIESVLDTIEQPLLDSGLGFIQCVEDLNLITTIYDTESDVVIQSKVPLILNKQDMQQLGSAITYARRYGLVSMFGLEQEDDDGNLASGNSQKQVQQNQVQEVKELKEVKEYISKEQATGLNEYAKQQGQDVKKLLEFFKVDGLLKLTTKQYQFAMSKIKNKEF